MNAPRNTILQGDSLALLKTLPDGCVQTCVTSPPYWGLRDYGTLGQIGLEPTLAEYIAKMVELFAEVRRVLRKDGTLWLNMGDSYAAGKAGRTDYGTGDLTSTLGPLRNGLPNNTRPGPVIPRKPSDGLKPKDLCGVPWRLAFALQDAGWWLRSDIIWAKPNPMPESVTDRPTRSHEYLFLLTKSEKYFYDAEAIREDVTGGSHPRTAGRNSRIYVDRDPAHLRPGVTPKSARPGSGIKANSSFHAVVNDLVAMRNKRSVWTVATHPFPEAHFATFPPALIEPCILAGSRPGDLVLDPFMGAGTTAIVAVKHSRDYLGIELNPDYIDIANRRLARGVQMTLQEYKEASA